MRSHRSSAERAKTAAARRLHTIANRAALSQYKRKWRARLALALASEKHSDEALDRAAAEWLRDIR
jgi:hypothetical protein